jgi:hypothetical protein
MRCKNLDCPNWDDPTGEAVPNRTNAYRDGMCHNCQVDDIDDDERFDRENTDV